MRVDYRVRVCGRVQGVFYRAWTREQADALGVTGWVRNCEDGSVEAQLSGEREAVEQLIERMRSGPAGARVAELRSTISPGEQIDRFDVRH